MSEPLHTEEVRARVIFKDEASRPFKDRGDKSVSVSLGPLRGESVISEFEKTGSLHGRNMTERTSSKAVFWGGPLPGDIYGATTIKGAEMRPHIFRGIEIGINSYSEYGFMVLGLMDDSVLPRVKRASEVMRRNGLPTERPGVVKELKEVYIGKEVYIKKNDEWERVPIERWEKQALNSYKGDSLYDKVKRYLRETKFITLERDVQVDERIYDLIDAINDGELENFIAPIFKWLNAATKIKRGGLISGTLQPEPFIPTPDDTTRYIATFLPTQMGIYLGRLHRLGIAHGYPTPGNWSAVGTLVDLDSVSGKKIFSDDKEPSQDAYNTDLDSTLTTLGRLSEAADFHSKSSIGINQSAVKKLFMLNYLIEKYGPHPKLEQISAREQQLMNRYNADLVTLREYGKLSKFR